MKKVTFRNLTEERPIVRKRRERIAARPASTASLAVQ